MKDEADMKNTDDNQNFSKAEILAEIIYKAIVRYSIAKKDAKTNKKANFRLDCERVWSANKGGVIDNMER